jgi:hypothetical protein
VAEITSPRQRASDLRAAAASPLILPDACRRLKASRRPCRFRKPQDPSWRVSLAATLLRGRENHAKSICVHAKFTERQRSDRASARRGQNVAGAGRGPLRCPGNTGRPANGGAVLNCRCGDRAARWPRMAAPLSFGQAQCPVASAPVGATPPAAVSSTVPRCQRRQNALLLAAETARLRRPSRRSAPATMAVRFLPARVLAAASGHASTLPYSSWSG